jgi:hypothetical protein
MVAMSRDLDLDGYFITAAKHRLNLVSEAEFKMICRENNAEFCGCHAPDMYMTYDVVGATVSTKPAIEYFRLPGLLFRYFDSHGERLAEFQQRLDKAKLRLSR